MKLLVDLFPVALFFAAYKAYDIFVATAVIIAATAVQVGATWLWKRRVEKMHLATLLLVVLLGGATLLAHDEMFVKWKPTLVNALFAAVFLGSHFIGKKTLVERMMGSALTLPSAVWARVSLAWVGFFLATGALNLVVAYRFDTDTWVDFKLFGLMGLTLVFVLAQALYLGLQAAKHAEAQQGEGH